jgi:hypothetical protein
MNLEELKGASLSLIFSSSHTFALPEEQSRALERLTDGLREALDGVYLPSELRSLVLATEADRQGRVPSVPLAPGLAARPQHPHAINTGYRCDDICFKYSRMFCLLWSACQRKLYSA